MASKPGVLTEWPWRKLGSFKYAILAPWVAHSLFTLTKEGEKDLFYVLIFPILLWRYLHNQIWISFARFQTARSKHWIVRKSIEFEQVDREMNWDDQIILNGIIFYMASMLMDASKNLPLWRIDGAVLMALFHMGPVEFLYYWLHRALHHHFLYSRYHSHHHSSIATEPITSVIHPFAEILLYYLLFTIPFLATAFTRTVSILAAASYLTYLDFMNNLGHCNFELVPRWLFTIFPFLKYFMYTPTFHSLHHTQFRTNFSLFMPIYDYIYNTMDKSSDALYESMLNGKSDMPHVVHLSHPTTIHSIYHLRLGFAHVASKPYVSKGYLWMLWPFTWSSMLVTWLFGSTFTVEKIKLNELKMQTWAIPRYSFQYMLSWQRNPINNLIEKAILEAEQEGVKVISLGLLNQGEELNRNGELYLLKHPKLKVRIVDGSSLAAAVVLKSIPQGTKQVLLQGSLSKVGYAITLALCQRGVQVILVRENQFQKLKLKLCLPAKLGIHLVYSNGYNPKVWLVGDGLREEEQRKAPKGTKFIPFSQFPVKKIRKDCTYFNTPAMVIPKDLENMHACENWLPRRVMSAWRVAGIVHALEGWDAHECGDRILDVEKIWDAALQHGFNPFQHMQLVKINEFT